jgi:restriction system protein
MSGSKKEVLEKIDEVDEEQFEQLCKIIVEKTEKPANIELTPFHGDGGIDIRGHFGNQNIQPQFGVQVKHFSSNIGTPAMRNFVGALQEHHYQIGLFITSSDYASGAVNLANQQDITPISLLNGNDLAELMINSEIGVISVDDDSFKLDPDFWSIFNRTTSEDPVSTEEVPQADSIKILQYALMAIDNGYRYKPEIADYLARKTGDEWTDRQADYYPSAGYALGYVHKDTIGTFRGNEMRQWGLTREGQEYIELVQNEDSEEAHDHFIDHVEEMEIIQRILPEIKENDDMSHHRLKEIVAKESELNETTANRRASTIGRWLNELSYVTQKGSGASLRYEHIPARIDDF